MASVRRRKRFLLCVRNPGCEDLEPRKVYERLPDRGATSESYVRVVDESGDDYLYPEAYFVEVELPRQAERAIARRAQTKPSNQPLQRAAPMRRR
jgi:hypothetical protein